MEKTPHQAERQAQDARPMSFAVELSPTAEADLERLFDFLLDQADTTEDLDRAQAAIEAVGPTAEPLLATTPFSFRKAAQAQNPAQRELLIPFGSTGFVALYEIVSAQVRHFFGRQSLRRLIRPN